MSVPKPEGVDFCQNEITYNLDPRYTVRYSGRVMEPDEVIYIEDVGEGFSWRFTIDELQDVANEINRFLAECRVAEDQRRRNE